MDEELRAIREKLYLLQKAFDEKSAKLTENFERAHTLARFLTDTINSIAPGMMKAEWMGSLTNSGVTNYPQLEITVRLAKNFLPICTWVINPETGQIPELSAEDIVETINANLQKISL